MTNGRTDGRTWVETLALVFLDTSKKQAFKLEDTRG